jgi:hypothetical protein
MVQSIIGSTTCIRRGYSISLYGVVILFLGTISFCLAQNENMWRVPPPNISDIGLLTKQHYDKLGFTLLPDTIMDGIFPVAWYVSVHGLTIPLGGKAIFQQGTIILFEPGAKIDVAGKLQCRGTSELDVTLKAIRKGDRYLVAETDDTTWNGIIVRKGGTVDLRNVTISGALDGIVTKVPCTSLRLDSVTFHGIEGIALSIGTSVIQTPSDVPYSLNCGSLTPVKVKKKSSTILLCGSIGCSIGLGAGIAAILFHRQMKDAYNNGVNANGQIEYNEFRQQQSDAFGRRNIFAGISAASLLTGGVCLTIHFTRR